MSLSWSTLGFGIGALRSVGVRKCIMASVHHYNATQDNFTAWTILCVLPVHPSLHSPSWQPLIDTSTVSTILSFPECHSRSHSVCSLSDGPLSLGSMLWRSLHGFSWVDAHYFGAQITFHCLNVALFLHPFTGGQSWFPSECWQLWTEMLSLSYFSHCCDKMLNRRNLREGLFWHTVHGREVRVQEGEAASQDKWILGLSLRPSFYSVWDLSACNSTIDI